MVKPDRSKDLAHNGIAIAALLRNGALVECADLVVSALSSPSRPPEVVQAVTPSLLQQLFTELLKKSYFLAVDALRFVTRDRPDLVAVLPAAVQDAATDLMTKIPAGEYAQTEQTSRFNELLEYLKENEETLPERDSLLATAVQIAATQWLFAGTGNRAGIKWVMQVHREMPEQALILQESWRVAIKAALGTRFSQANHIGYAKIIEGVCTELPHFRELIEPQQVGKVLAALLREGQSAAAAELLKNIQGTPNLDEPVKAALTQYYMKFGAADDSSDRESSYYKKLSNTEIVSFVSGISDLPHYLGLIPPQAFQQMLLWLQKWGRLDEQQRLQSAYPYQESLALALPQALRGSIAQSVAVAGKTELNNIYQAIKGDPTQLAVFVEVVNCQLARWANENKTIEIVNFLGDLSRSSYRELMEIIRPEQLGLVAGKMLEEGYIISFAHLMRFIEEPTKQGAKTTQVRFAALKQAMLDAVVPAANAQLANGQYHRFAMTLNTMNSMTKEGVDGLPPTQVALRDIGLNHGISISFHHNYGDYWFIRLTTDGKPEYGHQYHGADQSRNDFKKVLQDFRGSGQCITKRAAQKVGQFMTTLYLMGYNEDVPTNLREVARREFTQCTEYLKVKRGAMEVTVVEPKRSRPVRVEIVWRPLSGR